MLVILAAFSCGLVFGWGLQLSGMTDPSKIFGFLDFFGAWDPSLAVVMASRDRPSFAAVATAGMCHERTFT